MSQLKISFPYYQGRDRLILNFEAVIKLDAVGELVIKRMLECYERIEEDELPHFEIVKED